MNMSTGLFSNKSGVQTNRALTPTFERDLSKNSIQTQIKTTASNEDVSVEVTEQAMQWCTRWYKQRPVLAGYVEQMGLSKCVTRLMEVLKSPSIAAEKNKWAGHNDLIDIMAIVLRYDFVPDKEITIISRGGKMQAELSMASLLKIAAKVRPEMELSTEIWTARDYKNFQLKHGRKPRGGDFKDALCASDEDISNNTAELFMMPGAMPSNGKIDENTIGLIHVIWTNTQTGVRVAEMFSMGYLMERMRNVKPCVNKTGVWKTDPIAMWVKTSIKQFLKLKAIDLGLPFHLLHTEDERVEELNN